MLPLKCYCYSSLKFFYFQFLRRFFEALKVKGMFHSLSFTVTKIHFLPLTRIPSYIFFFSFNVPCEPVSVSKWANKKILNEIFLMFSCQSTWRSSSSSFTSSLSSKALQMHRRYYSHPRARLLPAMASFYCAIMKLMMIDSLMTVL
jgi:hypothetical protein